GIGAEQRAVAGHVDDAGDARRQPVYLGQRPGGEYLLGGAGDAQAVTHIAQGLFARQRLQVVAAGDSLRQLAQVRAVEQFAQLRLADQYDLQQFLGGSFEVGQQAYLFQHLGGQVLRLVHDDDDAPSLGVRRQQPPIQRIDHLLDAIAVGVRDIDPQFFADGQQKFDRRDARIQYDRDVRVMRHARQQSAHHGGLARAHLSGQLNEAAGFVDAVKQMRQSLGV